MHGGVRPWWQQGSSETYSVAPAGSSPQAASAIALGVLPRRAPAWKPSPITRPSLHDDGADERVRAGLPARLCGELDAPEEVALVALCGRGLGHFAALRASPVDSRVNSTSGSPRRPLRCGACNVRPARCTASARPHPRRRLRPARVEQRLRAAVRLDSIDEGSHFTNRAVEMFWQDLDPGLLPEPVRLHVPRLRPAAGDVRPARLPLRPPVRERDRRSSTRTRRRSGSPRATLAAVLCMAGVAATYWAARRLWGVREGLVAAAVLSLRVPAGGLLARGGDRRGRAHGRGARALRRRAGVRGRARSRYYRGRPAPPRASPSRSSTRPAWRSLPLAIAALARLRADRAARARGPRARAAPGRRSCSSRSTPTCSARSTPGGTTFATRPRWRRTSRSPARSPAASPTTSRASPGGSAGPRRSPRCSAPRSSCGAISCAG